MTAQSCLVFDYDSVDLPAELREPRTLLIQIGADGAENLRHAVSFRRLPPMAAPGAAGLFEPVDIARRVTKLDSRLENAKMSAHIGFRRVGVFAEHCSPDRL